jgi:hypothetical protein
VVEFWAAFGGEMGTIFFKQIPRDRASTQLFGAFFEPGFASFQMVPFGDDRTWEVRVPSGSTISVRSLTEKIAVVARDDGSLASPLLFKSGGLFKIKSNKMPGFLHVIATDQAGVTLDFLEVSVKTSVKATFSGCTSSRWTLKDRGIASGGGPYRSSGFRAVSKSNKHNLYFSGNVRPLYTEKSE